MWTRAINQEQTTLSPYPNARGIPEYTRGQHASKVHACHSAVMCVGCASCVVLCCTLPPTGALLYAGVHAQLDPWVPWVLNGAVALLLQVLRHSSIASILQQGQQPYPWA
jgi:hypothetical protein